MDCGNLVENLRTMRTNSLFTADNEHVSENMSKTENFLCTTKL